jgi:hypothetical protein
MSRMSLEIVFLEAPVRRLVARMLMPSQIAPMISARFSLLRMFAMTPVSRRGETL